MTITLTINGQTRKANRAPKGGATVNGKFYRGGQFMPKQDEIEQLVEVEYAEHVGLYGADESYRRQIRNRIIREQETAKETEEVESTPMVRLVGNTYSHRKTLKSLGFQWDGSAWTGRKGLLNGRNLAGIRVQSIELSGVDLYDDMDRNENSVY